MFVFIILGGKIKLLYVIYTLKGKFANFFGLSEPPKYDIIWNENENFIDRSGHATNKICVL